MNSSGLQRLHAIHSMLSCFCVDSFATPFVEMQTTSLNISETVIQVKEIANTVDFTLNVIDERLELPHCWSFLIKLILTDYFIRYLYVEIQVVNENVIVKV